MEHYFSISPYFYVIKINIEHYFVSNLLWSSTKTFQIRIPLLSLHAEMSVADTMTNAGAGIPISVSVMTSLGGSGKKSSSKKDSACIVVPANLLDVPD